MASDAPRGDSRGEQSGVMIAARVIVFMILLPALLIYLIKVLLD
jgi:hypothetical protein